MTARPVLICLPPETDVATELGGQVVRLLPAGEATMLSVFPPHHLPISPFAAVAEAVLHVPAEFEAADRALAEAACAAAGDQLAASGWQVASRIERDPRPPWAVALDLADEVDAQVIVVGAGRHYVPSPGALGRETRALAHRTRRPLLVLPAPTGDTESTGPVLVAFDGSAPSQHALDVGGEILGPREAVVATVWAPLAAQAMSARVAVPVAVITAGAHKLDEAARDAAAQTASDGASRLSGADWSATGRQLQGTSSAWPALAAAAGDLDASLILTGTRGHSKLTATLIGSVAEGLLRHAHRPILLVPPPAEDE